MHRHRERRQFPRRPKRMSARPPTTILPITLKVGEFVSPQAEFAADLQQLGTLVSSGFNSETWKSRDPAGRVIVAFRMRTGSLALRPGFLTWVFGGGAARNVAGSSRPAGPTSGSRQYVVSQRQTHIQRGSSPSTSRDPRRPTRAALRRPRI
jgi:hypothetical protein